VQCAPAIGHLLRTNDGDSGTTVTPVGRAYLPDIKLSNTFTQNVGCRAGMPDLREVESLRGEFCKRLFFYGFSVSLWLMVLGDS
jgi:hypothetical protein